MYVPSIPSKSKINVKVIVGAVVGGLVGLVLLLVLWLYCRRRSPTAPGSAEAVDLMQSSFRPVPYEYTPYQALDVIPPLQAAPVYMTKAREAVVPQSTASTSSSNTAQNSQPQTTDARMPSVNSPDGGLNVSPGDVQGLRVEVENLRRVMQTFQDVDRTDPPPLYEGS